jgi:peptide deformylase
MYAVNGAGLAAPQIGVARCLFVLAVEDDGKIGRPRVFVNPQVMETSGEQGADEACLSIPGLSVTIRRPERVELEAQDRDGEPFRLVATGFLAAAIMHEHDHLEGRLLVDRLSSLKRSILRKKIAKAKKSGRLVSHGAGL